MNPDDFGAGGRWTADDIAAYERAEDARLRALDCDARRVQQGPADSSGDGDGDGLLCGACGGLGHTDPASFSPCVECRGWGS